MFVHDTFAHYQTRARLGEGGMGEVFLAQDLRLNRPVALKVIKPDERGPDAVDRFIDTPRFRNYIPRHLQRLFIRTKR